MNLLRHFIVSLILVVLLFPFYGAYAFLAIITGFLIDADHLLIYFWRFRNLNLVKAYGYLTTAEMKKQDLFLLHSIELFIPLSFLPKPIMQPLIIGLVIHLALDIIEEFIVLKRSIKAYSLIYWGYIKFRNLFKCQLQVNTHNGKNRINRRLWRL